MFLKATFSFLLAVWLGAFGAFACQPLPKPRDAVVLQVSGEIARTNAGAEARFDRGMLRALDWETTQSFTKWTDGPQAFSGPTLAAVLDAVSAQGTRIKAYALNDYAVEFPISDAGRYNVLLAMEQDGKPMRVRNKGPIWIIYPIASAEEAVNAPVNHKMIWQLDRLVVLP